MSTDDYYPLSVILAHLEQSIQQRLSGTFLVATNDNASCRLALQQGRLTHCTFRRLHGEAAISAFTQIQAGRHSFNTNLAYPFRDIAQVEHKNALQILGLNLGQAETPKLKPVSGSLFTQEELEALFGKFYFE